MDGSPVDPELIHRMTRRLVHRGPDDEGTYVHRSIGLGHRRLSVLDLSQAGHQPMANQDGTVQVVFNGEIYNFGELRSTLEGKYRFASKTDTEVLLHLYEEYDTDCLHRLRGMFAFAIWDGRQRRLILARDRVGKKPLFYSVRSASITFASELQALLADDSLKLEIDPVAIHHYLTYQYIPAPLTIFRGVYKLPPAHVLTCDGAKLSISRYWELDYTKKLVMDTEEDYVEQFRHLLREAVQLRLVSDVPLGAFLSGGIDSSAVVALMSELSRGPVKTFSIGFQDLDHDERRYARAVADSFGTDHQEFIVNPLDVDVLPKLVETFSEPFADSSAIPMYYVSQLSRRFVTVVLTGDGGDELLAGYPHYRFPHREGLLESGPILAGWNAIRRVTHALPGQCWDRWVQSPETVYLNRLCYFRNDQKASLYTDDFTRAIGGLDSGLLLQEWFRDTKATEWLDRLLGVDLLSYLPNDVQVKVDLSTMAHGLEARCPFLDHRLMEFAASLPPGLKLRNGTSKYLMRKAMASQLPDRIVQRRKMGFGVPIQRWFRQELHDYLREVLMSPSAAERGYFKPERVQAMLSEHERGACNHGYRLYALLVLELWHRRFVDQRVSYPVEAGSQLGCA